MAWRYRRSKSFGPFRLTASNSGLGFSFGGPLGRVSVNTRGQVRQTTRIPGLGLYNTQQIGTIGGSSRKSNQRSGPSHYAPAAPTRQTSTTPHLTAALPVTRAGALPAYELATARSRARAIVTTIALVILETTAVLFLIGVAGSAKAPDWVGAILIVVLFVALLLTIRSGRTPKPAANNIVNPPTLPITSTQRVAPTPIEESTTAPTPSTATSAPATGNSTASNTALVTPSNLPAQVSANAFDATGGILDLDPLKPGVVSVNIVDVENTPAKVADLIRLPTGVDGLRHGTHEGLLIPTGTQWRAYCLIHSDDNPELFEHQDAGAAISVHVGRLGIRDVRTYAPLFSGHPVQISLYVEATPGLEHFEVRFLDRPATHDDDQLITTPAPAEMTTAATTTAATTTTTPAQPLPAANWFTDPTNDQQWRWWDGTSWTTYTAPK